MTPLEQKLLTENEDLKSEVSALKAELRLNAEAAELEAMRNAFRFTNAQAALVVALYRANGRALSRLDMDEAVPSPRGDRNNLEKIFDVHLVRVRKKLGPDSIENVWGRGWRLSKAGMEICAAAMKRECVS